MVVQEALIKAGLTKNEAKVYLTLVDLGKSKAGVIVREAKIAGGKVYETLYSLIDKGILSYSTENGVKYFSANDPETILKYLEDKKESIEESKSEIGKFLTTLRNNKEKNLQETTEIITSLKGIKTVVDKLFEKKESFKIMGITATKNDLYNDFWRRWHLKRINRKKKAKMIFSERGSEYYNFFKKLKDTQVKVIEHINPSAIMIVGNEVLIFSYTKEMTCIHIKSEGISLSFNNFFEDLWNQAKP